MLDLTQIIVQRFAGADPGGDDQANRCRYAMLEAWVSVLGNALLFAAKLALGLIANSVSLIADAFHTLGDLVSSVIVMIGSRASRKPADEKHPYGHGRAEPIATLVIAMLLIVVAVEFAHLSYHRLRAPEPLKATWLVAAAMVLSIAAKEWMARFSNHLADLASSDMLRADAWHHRSDAIAAGLVIAAAVGARFGHPALDGLFGLGVAIMIGFIGYRVGQRMISVLMGEAPTDEVLRRIEQSSLGVQGVLGVHDVSVHEYGVNRHVSLHVQVDSEATTGHSHDTATAVERRLSEELRVWAVVHVDPEPCRAGALPLHEVRSAMERFVGSHDAVNGYHRLHAVRTRQGWHVELHLQIDPSLSLTRSHQLVHQVAAMLKDEAGVGEADIHVEPADTTFL